MLAIFSADAGTFDLFIAVAVVISVLAGFLLSPDRTPGTPVRAKAYGYSVLALAVAVGFFAFLFMTP